MSNNQCVTLLFVETGTYILVLFTKILQDMLVYTNFHLSLYLINLCWLQNCIFPFSSEFYEYPTLDLYTRNEWLDLEITSMHHFCLSWSMCRWRAFFQPDWVCHIVSYMLIWCKSGTSTFHVKHFWYVSVHKYHKFYKSMPKDNDFSIGTTIILCLYPFYLFHFFLHCNHHHSLLLL